MKCNIFNIIDIPKLMRLHSDINILNDAFVNAYNIIFDTKVCSCPKLIEKEISVINNNIKSIFKLFETLPHFEPLCAPEHDIIRMLNIAIIHWFFEQWSNKKKKQEQEKTTYIWQIPSKDATALRRTFKNKFGATQEQLIATCFFYLLPTLVKSIKDKDLWVFGSIVCTIAENNIIMQKNAKYITGGKLIHTKEKTLAKAYSLLQKDYKNIKNKPYDEQVLYCVEHFNVDENDAEMLLLRIKK